MRKKGVGNAFFNELDKCFENKVPYGAEKVEQIEWMRNLPNFMFILAENMQVFSKYKS